MTIKYSIYHTWLMLKIKVQWNTPEYKKHFVALCDADNNKKFIAIVQCMGMKETF